MDYKTERQLRAELAVAWMLVDQYKIALARNCEWQPIETAPRDGTAILGYDGRTMTTVEWFDIGLYWSLVEFGSYAEDCEWTPTHWMPLPDPPKP